MSVSAVSSYLSPPLSSSLLLLPSLVCYRRCRRRVTDWITQQRGEEKEKKDRKGGIRLAEWGSIECRKHRRKKGASLNVSTSRSHRRNNNPIQVHFSWEIFVLVQKNISSRHLYISFHNFFLPFGPISFISPPIIITIAIAYSDTQRKCITNGAKIRGKCQSLLTGCCCQ